MELIHIILKGGTLVYILFILSLIGLSFFLERYFFLRKFKFNNRVFINKIKTLILSNKINDSITLCDENPSPVSHVIKSMLKKKDLQFQEIKDSIENETQLQIYQLEKFTGIIRTIAAVSPLIGFLGTVTGMIKTFMAIESNTGQVNPSLLAGGIWEALVTTAVGLAIGIIMLLGYNYIMTHIERFTFEIKQSASELLEIFLTRGNKENE